MTEDFLQQTSQPLFPNMIWTRPETKSGAGKLLIIGGQAQEFIHVAESYTSAEEARAGTVRVFMPDSTRKLTKMLPNIEYAPSNASGSFAKTALAELVDASQWCDGVLLAGDLGKNSETNLMLENFVTGYSEVLVIAGAALQSIPMLAKDLFLKDNNVLVLTFDEFQKLSLSLGLSKPVTSTINTVALADILKELTIKFNAALVVMQNKSIWTAYKGKTALTQPKIIKSNGQLAAAVAVWAIQNPSKRFEAITTAAYC